MRACHPPPPVGSQAAGLTSPHSVFLPVFLSLDSFLSSETLLAVSPGSWPLRPDPPSSSRAFGSRGHPQWLQSERLPACQVTTYICHLTCLLREVDSSSGQETKLQRDEGSFPKLRNLVARSGLEPGSVSLAAHAFIPPSIFLFLWSSGFGVLQSPLRASLKCCFSQAHHHRPSVRALGLGPGVCTLKKLPRLAVCRPHREMPTRAALSALVHPSGDRVPVPQNQCPCCRSWLRSPQDQGTFGGGDI